MVFPFVMTRRFKLSDSEYGSYSSDEIIDKIYDGIVGEKFNNISKYDRMIEFKGDFFKALFSFAFSNYYTYCIDYGVVKIEESKGHRIIFYKFQYFKLFLLPCIIGLCLSFLIGTMAKSIEIGFFVILFFLVLLSINWLLIFTINPLTISNTLELMRIEALKKTNKR
jgi:hypothetical protein